MYIGIISWISNLNSFLVSKLCLILVIRLLSENSGTEGRYWLCWFECPNWTLNNSISENCSDFHLFFAFNRYHDFCSFLITFWYQILHSIFVWVIDFCLHLRLHLYLFCFVFVFAFWFYLHHHFDCIFVCISILYLSLAFVFSRLGMIWQISLEKFTAEHWSAVFILKSHTAIFYSKLKIKPSKNKKHISLIIIIAPTR